MSHAVRLAAIATRSLDKKITSQITLYINDRIETNSSRVLKIGTQNDRKLTQ